MIITRDATGRAGSFSGGQHMLIDACGKEKILAEIYRILKEIGLKVETQEMVRALLAIGCEETAARRVSIPKSVVEEIATRQKKEQARDAAVQELYYTCNIDWTHAALWRHQVDDVKRALKDKLLVSAFDCGPTKYYDYRRKKIVGVDTDIFIEMKKLAQSTPEVGYVANWYRNDVPPRLERLDSLILAFEYTDKSAGVEAIYPEVIRYLKEASDILSRGSDDEPGTYLAGSECIIPPLHLDDRSARDILERKRCGVRKYHVATMGALAVSLPITLAGAVAVSAAELLGGWTAVYAVDPEARFNARAISNGIDMKTGQPTYSGPEVHLINLGVKEIFDEFFGGHCWVDVFFSPSVANPGLRAVYENFYGSMARTRLSGRTDIPYIGVGTLGSGAVGSSTQLMLDIEVRKSQFCLKERLDTSDRELAYDEIATAVLGGQGFLSTDLTLERCRDLWRSEILSARNQGEGDEPAITEKSILDACDEVWRDNIRKNYEYAGLDKDRRNELRGLMEKARAELLDS
jgi:trimethylamine:corrinoid methyltransferase-like protein